MGLLADVRALLEGTSGAHRERSSTLYVEGVRVVRVLAAPAFVQWLDEARGLLGERGFKVGTVRTWSDGDYVKTDRGWVKTVMPTRVGSQVVLGPGDTISHDQYKQNLQRTSDELRGLLAAGTLPGTMQTQVQEAKQVTRQHLKRLPSFLGELEAAAPPGSSVSGRVKTFESVLGKLVRKPKYGTAKGLQDVTGTRIVCDSTKAVAETVAKLKKQYKVIGEDDYIAKPLGDMKYRSHHLIVQDTDGSAKEVQVRTRNQDVFGHWAHESYKPNTPQKIKAIAEHGPMIMEYASAMSDWLAAQDEGRDPGPRPIAPPVVREVFGEIGAH